MGHMMQFIAEKIENRLENEEMLNTGIFSHSDF